MATLLDSLLKYKLRKDVEVHNEFIEFETVESLGQLFQVSSEMHAQGVLAERGGGG